VYGLTGSKGAPFANFDQSGLKTDVEFNLQKYEIVINAKDAFA